MDPLASCDGSDGSGLHAFEGRYATATTTTATTHHAADDSVSSVPAAPLAPAAACCNVPRGTPAFLAPEMLADPAPAATHASDLWALGATLYGLRYGVLPFAGATLDDLRFATARELRFPGPIPATGSPECQWRELLSGLLRRDPAQRADIDGLLAMPILMTAGGAADVAAP